MAFEIIPFYKQLLRLFLFMGAGALTRSTGLITEKRLALLSRILIDVMVPCLIFSAFLQKFSRDMIVSGFFVALIGFAVTFAGYIFGKLCAPLLPEEYRASKMFLALCSLGNTTFLPIPLVFSLYGPRALLFVFLYDFGCAVIVWTLGVKLFSGGKEKMRIVNFLTPGLLTMLLAVTLVFFSAGSVLPGAALQSAAVIGSGTIPLALLMVGWLLSEAFGERTFNAAIAFSCFIKLILVPAIVLAFLKFFGASLSPLTKTIILLEAAMPAMSSSAVFAKRYGGDTRLASSGVFYSTLFSFLSVPFFLRLMR